MVGKFARRGTSHRTMVTANLPTLRSSFPDPADEFIERGELLRDDVDGRLVGELERLLVEFLRRKGDQDLRPAEQDGVDRDQALPQVILHACAAEHPAGARL